jgi:hypothetical protein
MRGACLPKRDRGICERRAARKRLSRCILSFNVRSGNLQGLVNQSIMEKAIFLEMTEPAGQHSLFVETARLSEGFYAQLQRHPVPLEDAAIRAINNNSMASDIYAWLAYRLHALAAARSISWNALKPQFGGGFARRDHFKEQFLVNLRLALAVYPDAKVDVEEGGLVLHSSRPPVSPRAFPRSIQARR